MLEKVGAKKENKIWTHTSRALIIFYCLIFKLHAVLAKKELDREERERSIECVIVASDYLGTQC